MNTIVKVQLNSISSYYPIYSELIFAFNHFNENLFENTLPSCIISFHRQRYVVGSYSPSRWKSRDGLRLDEIVINPEYFDQHPLLEIFQTMCHEMVHMWQFHYGNPPKRIGYHNKEWARKMVSIGLMPSSTGIPGGTGTGEFMMDYVLYEKPFFNASLELISQGFNLPLVDTNSVPRFVTDVLAYTDDNEPIELDEHLHPKQTLSCPSCLNVIYSLPNLKVICNSCDTPYQLRF